MAAISTRSRHCSMRWRAAASFSCRPLQSTIITANRRSRISANGPGRSNSIMCSPAGGGAQGLQRRHPGPHQTGDLDRVGRMAGMTPLQALRAATGWAAECIGRGDDLGTLERGKLADLVVVAGDPLAEVSILQERQRIALVIKDGVIAVDRRARHER